MTSLPESIRSIAMAAGTISDMARSAGADEKLGFTELEGRIHDVCFCCASSVRPPLEKGGQGGLKGRASTLGRCDNSAEDSRPGTAHQAVVTRGYPPCPPFSRGGRRATESGWRQGLCKTNFSSPRGQAARVK